MFRFDFPFYPQFDTSDCGAACLRMVSKYYGRNFSQHELRENVSVSREGSSILGISLAAEAIGFRTIGVKITFDKLSKDVILPCIVFWNQSHFVVVYKITKTKIYVADPSGGLLSYGHSAFFKSWLTPFPDGVSGVSLGIALVLQPTQQFYEYNANGKDRTIKHTISDLVLYLQPHKQLLLWLVFGLILGGLMQLFLPFITQAVVDDGINNRNMSFINLLLAGQLILFVGMISNNFIQRLVTLHLSTRINISAISDYLMKLFRLPLPFFEGRMIGDILKRIEDHYVVQQFLSTSILSFIFSFLNLIVFSIVLLVYNDTIFFVFIIFTVIYLTYIFLFLKKRAELDYKRFQQLSFNYGSLIQIVQGMAEIKLNNSETFKKWEWEKIQAKIFKVNVNSMKLSQYQDAGGQFINHFKNLLLTSLTAAAVVNNQMSLGMMVAVQFILGQLNGPVSEFVGFVQRWQDARLAIERINEIKQISSEENEADKFIQFTLAKEASSIHLDNVSFSYGQASEKVLDGITTTFEEGKVTAIVGVSGSGKTTLLKLLLKFYNPTQGVIRIGGVNLKSIKATEWRALCGVVMQDGYIFSESIGKNIALTTESIDFNRLLEAAKLACIHDFIESLPLSYSTNVGANGIGLSQGQKQRLLIARALYKEPSFIMFDEATSSLDANNEKVIMANMKEIFKGRTVVVIAHRLSTVRNADRIIVVDRGKMIESGNHDDLIALKGFYYQLVLNQLQV